MKKAAAIAEITTPLQTRMGKAYPNVVAPSRAGREAVFETTMRKLTPRLNKGSGALAVG